MFDVARVVEHDVAPASVGQLDLGHGVVTPGRNNTPERLARIAMPEDLAGKRIALRSFHTTLSVLARGDLKSYWETQRNRHETILKASGAIK